MPISIGRQILETKDSDKFQSLFYNNQVIMLLIDPDTQMIIDVNPAAENYYGWKKEIFTQKKVSEINTLSEEEVQAEIQNAIQEKRQYFEFRHQLANGNIRDVEVFSNPIEHQGQTILFSIIHDITSRKQVEKEKYEIESLYKALVDQASESFFIHDFYGKIIEVNHQAVISLGYREDELLQMSVMDFEQDFDLVSAQAEWKKIEPGKPFTLFGHYKRKDGTTFPVEIRFGCSIWKGNKIFTVLARDISKRVQAEKELRATQISFKTAFEYSAVGACMISADGNFLYANRAMGEMLGYDPTILVGTHFNRFSHPEDHDIGNNEIQALFDKKEASVSFTKRYINKSEKIFWVDITMALLRDENDLPTHFLAQIQDITIRKEANEAIEKHRRALQLFIEYAPAAIAMFDKNMVYVSASRRFYTDYHLEEFSIIGKSHYEVFPEIPERVRELYQRCLLGNSESCDEEPFPRKNGKMDWIRWEIHPWYENDTDIGGIILFSEVITEKKKAEERINAQVKRLKSLRSIDMAIINSFDVTTMLNVLLDSLILTLDVDAADVLLVEPVSNTLKTEVHKGFFTPRTIIENIPLDKGLAGKSFITRKTAFLSNIEDEVINYSRDWLVTEENFVSYIGIPLIAKGQIKGILEVFHRSPLEPDLEWMEFLESLAGQAAIAVDNSQIYENMRRINLNLSLAYEETIEGWSAALDLRDKEPAGHTQYLANLTTKLCQAMNMNEKETIHARRGALLHDIGKIIIPDEILLKPGPLSNPEWEIIRKHPDYAYEILSSIEYLSPALEIPYNHHERWNGSGYPRGLKENQIPLSARIFSVIDVWDALTSPRPFRAAWLEEEALKYIQREAGKLFDPEVVKNFVKILQT